MITNKNSVQKTTPAPDWTPLRAMLRRRGGRLTPQRVAIFEAVVGQTTHPSVETVHTAVRERFPAVSQATVYATLDLLAELGFIQEVGGRVRRYDGRAGRHVNLVCERCGEVADVADPRLATLERRTAMRAGFDVRSARFELHGLCRRCRVQVRWGRGAGRAARPSAARAARAAHGARRREGSSDA